jgi:hypothetical protein
LAALEVEALKKPEPRSSELLAPSGPVDQPKLLAKLPTIADLLLTPTWEDGSPKEGTCLFVFPSTTLVKLLVKVGCPPLKLMVQGRNWDEAWACLEAILKGPDVPWEQDTGGQAGSRKKKK